MIKSLIVEDSIVCAKVISGVVSAYGPTKIVDNGHDAVTEFYAEWDAGVPYDIIWMDIVLPGMDGVAASTLIREYEDKYDLDPTYIVFCTAIGDMKDLIRAFFKRSRTSFLIKPLTTSMIKGELCRVQCGRGEFEL